MLLQGSEGKMRKCMPNRLETKEKIAGIPVMFPAICCILIKN